MSAEAERLTIAAAEMLPADRKIHGVRVVDGPVLDAPGQPRVLVNIARDRRLRANGTN